MSNMDYPAKVVESNIEIEVNRVHMPFLKMVLLGIFAGMFIALGAAASNVVMHAVPNVAVARLLAGAVFPVGLMMIVLMGGELFTGDCFLILGILDKKVRILSAIRILVVVYISNLVGAMLIAFLVYHSGQFQYTDGLLGAFTIKVALGKVSLDFGSAFSSGILCNIFVCAAVLMASAAKDVAGKVWAVFFPIMAFVVSGYEHCVANMYYIPAGLFAKGNSAYVQKAMEKYGYTQGQIDHLTWGNFFSKSALPVTIGNIVGGMLLVGIILYLIYQKNIHTAQKEQQK